MWHEARKHEKKLRIMIVDYRKRAERRREFYEKFKADPTQFMQVHGRQCKIHMDHQITAAADKCLVPWQDQKDLLIDRFDGRAHLDWIEEAPQKDKDDIEEKEEAVPGLNYERYRILIQNDVAGISEDKFLHQIHIEEQFGTAAFKPDGRPAKLAIAPKAAIAYNYDDSTPTSSANTKKAGQDTPAEDSEEDVDFDLIVNVNDLTIAQTSELNQNATSYGMSPGSFMTFLNTDIQEREQIRRAKLEVEEKQALSGRKARRERRAFKDRIILRKGYISPPSYAAADSPAQVSEEKEHSSNSDSESRSRVSSPEKITFITSFGENESKKTNDASLVGPSLSLGSLPHKTRKKWERRRSNSRTRLKTRRSRTRSRSRSPFRKRRYKSRSRSPDYKMPSYRRSSSRRNSNHQIRQRRRTSSSTSSSSSSDKNNRGRNSRSTSRRIKSRSSSSSRSRSRTRRREKRRSDSFRRSRSGSPRSFRRGRTRRSHSRGRGRKSRSPVKSSRKRSSPSRSSSSDSRSSRTKTLPKNNNGITSQSHDPASVSSPPVKRYYGREGNLKEDEDSTISLSSSDSEKEHTEHSSRKSSQHQSHGRSGRNPGRNSKSTVNSASKEHGSSGPILTPQEKLKRRMQLALNKQLKVDKEAERSRLEKLDQERMEREESLRELTIKYRRREREKRHRGRGSSSSSSSDSDSDKNSFHSRRSSGNRSPSADS